MNKPGLNDFLSAFFGAKITGKGKKGNAKIYTMMMGVIADRESPEISAELNILNKFGGLSVTPDSYHKLDRALSRFIKCGTGYPYEVFSFKKFEKCSGDSTGYRIYVSEMQKVLDQVIDPEKINALTYTLTQLILNDDSAEDVLYGGRFMQKNEFRGRAAHIKKICTPSLVLYLLYHLHERPEENLPAATGLIPVPEKYFFEAVRYENEKSFILEAETSIADLLNFTSRNMCTSENSGSAPDVLFENALICEGELKNTLAGDENMFVYGTGGIGKTSFLLRNSVMMNSCVCMYFPLYRYRQENVRISDGQNCWTAVQILLKYIYQYEYGTFDLCCASEGTENVMKNLSELLLLLRADPGGADKKYVLLLDGLNEMQPECQDIFAEELNMICSEWKNTRVIVSGRTVPEYTVFDKFLKSKVSYIPREKITEILSRYRNDNSGQNISDELAGILRIPLFLNIFLKSRENGKNICTRGELIDSYTESFGEERKENSFMRFTVQFILPVAAKMMNDSWSFEISRSELSEAAEKAFDIFIRNENVYQNFVAVKGFRKKQLIKSRERFDVVEYITENICLMKHAPGQPHILHFTHQFFRDYFAARHILNIFQAADISYGYGFNDEKKEMFCSNSLDLMWAACNNDDFFRMMGEITGDYLNTYKENFEYHRTVLDDILEYLKNIASVHGVENIMLTMKAARGNIICGCDFSGTTLPVYFPEDVCFSAEGLFPCKFRDCWVFNIRNYETSVRSFINCDFSGSVFFDDECMEFLRNNHAVVTENDLFS